MAEQAEQKPAVLILAGTTASGKTDVSIPLSQLLNAEILSADSRQVYRELRIGTAPPTSAQLEAVPHHFIASRSLRDRWTAGDFAREARKIIDGNAARGIISVVVGGSMLYLRALKDGLYDSDVEPTIDYDSLRAEWEKRGREAMMEELRGIDPDFAASTQASDHHRILRAIGLWRATGQTISVLRKASSKPLTVPYRLYFLHGNREVTYQRVNRRVDDMLASGLVEEVRALLQQGFDESNCNALRTHGYQEVLPYLRGEYGFEDMRDKIQKAVRHYVKRQLTWFRRESQAVWVERAFDEPPEEIARRIYDDFAGRVKISNEKTR
ncbi:tRNA (adenosine(37)-N6)-dimethylallyltransferase MiaA [bacterium]|nr:tRNA (adenosine(37)-N6)-dimethylallyltransferase MiaA [bacterium]